MPTYFYSYTDTEIYVNQFASSRLKLDGLTLVQESEMPWGGSSTLRAEGGRYHPAYPHSRLG